MRRIKVENINNQLWIACYPLHILLWFHKEYRGIGRAISGFRKGRYTHVYRVGFVSFKTFR